MKTTRCTLSALAALLVAVPLAAQEPPVEPPLTDSLELAFEREVFGYPQFARRNPFKPLVTAAAGGPRFEELRLLGIIYSPDPDRSVVLFGAGTVAPRPAEGEGEQKAPGVKTYRVRRGEILGNTRVVEIQRMRITVEVEEFGLTERRVLELPRPNQGGSR